MKGSFFPKLAWSGIRNNHRLYIPYLLTCTGMVMMYYIVYFLAHTNAFEGMSGEAVLQSMLDLGCWIIALFACLFLSYSGSFLQRRRRREFGLYNVLGMDKRNLGWVLFWETLITAALSLSLGLAAGVALSKAAELGMINMMHGEISDELTISPRGLAMTAAVFGGIFLLILLRSLWQLRKNNAVALLHSESTGEKPPRANWVLGSLGVVLLGVAYYMAVAIADPLSALLFFFVAVCLVIIGTYLLFIAGSVMLCRILQKNSRYYYKANHFVSVSSMAYRMKRNGAGLASICILITMVLVMLSSTSCLYFGTEDSLNTRYPRDITLRVYADTLQGLDDSQVGGLRERIQAVLGECGAQASNTMDYRSAVVSGILTDGELETDSSQFQVSGLNVYQNVYTVYFVPLEDYNRMQDASETLEEDEVLLYSNRNDYPWEHFSIARDRSFRIKRQLDSFPIGGDAAVDMLPSLFVVVGDMQSALSGLEAQTYGDAQSVLSKRWDVGFDLDAPSAQHGEIADGLDAALEDSVEDAAAGFHWYVECRERNREDFYGTFGGLFALGLVLSVVFLFAAVLIIYYKQLSEGYEDQARFDIMRKVGMTRRDIHRSINAQLLIVFSLPLLGAGMHLAFAFPMIRKLLLLFNMNNIRLFVATTCVSYLIFGAFYIFVYKMTSNAYYHIVSGCQKEE